MKKLIVNALLLITLLYVSRIPVRPLPAEISIQTNGEIASPNSDHPGNDDITE